MSVAPKRLKFIENRSVRLVEVVQ